MCSHRKRDKSKYIQNTYFSFNYGLRLKDFVECLKDQYSTLYIYLHTTVTSVELGKKKTYLGETQPQPPAFRLGELVD